MVHLRILGALLAFAAVVHCRDPGPTPPQPVPDPGPTSAIVVEAEVTGPEEQPFEEVRL
jgi:hypothetical protein